MLMRLGWTPEVYLGRSASHAKTQQPDIAIPSSIVMGVYVIPIGRRRMFAQKRERELSKPRQSNFDPKQLS